VLGLLGDRDLGGRGNRAVRVDYGNILQRARLPCRDEARELDPLDAGRDLLLRPELLRGGCRCRQQRNNGYGCKVPHLLALPCAHGDDGGSRQVVHPALRRSSMLL